MKEKEKWVNAIKSSILNNLALMTNVTIKAPLYNF
jgi:hypothetical protein